jgi:hypothetical protein
MLSVNICDIGAGVAMGAGNLRFYVVDTALRTGNGLPQPAAASGSKLDSAAPTDNPESISISQYIMPVTVSTALPGGDVFHRVLYGQTFWSIAIQYGTTIAEIHRLNNLAGGATLRVGQILLIRRGATQPALAEASSVPETVSAIPSLARTDSVVTPTATEEVQSTVLQSAYISKGVIFGLTLMILVILIIIMAQWKKDAES